jgi:hypothetical protein
VFDLVGLASFILRNRIDLGLLGSRVRNQQSTQHGKVQPPCCWLFLQQIKQPLDLAMVTLDQLDNIGSSHVPLLFLRRSRTALGT